MNLSRDQKSEAKPDEGNKFEGEVRLWDQMSLAGVGPPLFKRGYLVIDKVAVNVFLYLRNGITFLRAIKFECIDSAFKQPVGTIVSFKFTETPYPSTSETKELDHIKEVYLRTDTSTVTTFSIILKSKLNEAARSSKNAFGSSQKASASMSRPMNRTILGSNLNIRRQNLGSVLPILGAQNNYAVIPPTKPNETCYIKSADGFDTDRIKSDQNKTLFKKVHEDHIDEIKIHQRERSKPPPKRSVSGVSSRTRNKTKKLFLNDYKAPVRSTSANKSLSDCEMWIDEKEDGELFSTEDISKAKSDSKIDQERMDIDDEGSALNASLLTGLTNIGNTCYMNAVIQALRSLKIFRAACNQVKKLIKQNCHVIEASPEQLLPFYTKYEQLHSTPSSSELKECLDELRLTVMKEEKNEERLVMREQEDAHEFLVKFIDKIGTEMKQALEILDIQSEDPSYSSLTYKLIRKLACEKCKDNRPSDDEGNHFMLHFIGHQSEAPNMLSIASLFRNSLLAEMVSTRCPKCGHASALMTQEFAKLPK
uniref:USP domain-containing protein n=1 Tax=Acrobeloides nanus TaxID=290746 RepID=A0A914CVX1_9BILA